VFAGERQLPRFGHHGGMEMCWHLGVRINGQLV
jgi:hypothetical protein